MKKDLGDGGIERIDHSATALCAELGLSLRADHRQFLLLSFTIDYWQASRITTSDLGLIRPATEVGLQVLSKARSSQHPTYVVPLLFTYHSLKWWWRTRNSSSTLYNT